ncbi:MAG TPA: SulP family inorganic anion transporter [Actinomycetota bacterium]|jgi:sulfate permease, SulP family|nr:SulP family inorganic anion transporter [Actinomycetota bacterium]
MTMWRTPGGLDWSLPLFRSLDGYRWQWLPRDLTAGLLIVTIAVPLSMGMAEVAGVPPIAGLYSCVLPLIAYALLGSSPQLVVALDASTAALVAVAVAPLAAGDPVRYVGLAALVAIIVGVMLVAAGLLRLGVVARLLTRPVLLGYQAGLALVVIFSQLPRLLGLGVEHDDSIPRALEIATRIDEWSVRTALFGVAALVVIVVLAATRPRIPSAVLVIVAAALAVEVAGPALSEVEVVGSLPSGLPPIGVPDVGFGDVMALIPISAAIAILAAADTIVSSTAFAQRNGYEVDANRDLVGLGSANLASGLSGGITTSASAARTAVVEMVGGRSQLASVTAALGMVVVLLFLTDPLESLPTTALAAVVIAAVLRLIEVRSLLDLWRRRRLDFVIAITTTVGAVAIGLLQGIVIGVALSLLSEAPGARGRRLHRAEGPTPDVPIPRSLLRRSTGASRPRVAPAAVSV